MKTGQILYSLLAVIFLLTARPATAQVVTWQALQGYVNSIQNQINVINAQLASVGSGGTTPPLPFGNLPTTCVAGWQRYCSDCKSVSDGITNGSTCVGSGNGSFAVCKAGNVWKCGS